MSSSVEDITVSIGPPRPASAISSFVAGASAGLIVDVGLFPIDTIKTRLQAVGGFRANGGFTGVYRGLGVVTMGSVPGGAVFFSTYDSISGSLSEWADEHASETAHAGSPPTTTVLATKVIAGSIAECSACLVRVPVEFIKQRLQVGIHNNMSDAFAEVWKSAQGELKQVGGQQQMQRSVTFVPRLVRLLYKGYPITVFREVPFAMIQMPLYETLKARFRPRSSPDAHHTAVLVSSSSSTVPELFSSLGAPLSGIAPGFISGGVSAVLTTPLDVVKTRIMTMRIEPNRESPLVKQGAVRTAYSTMRSIVKNEGVKALFSGGATRASWISVGGALFFGTYETVKASMERQRK